MDSCGTYCPADINRDFFNYPITREGKKLPFATQGVFLRERFFRALALRSSSSVHLSSQT
jgi:hypothetical protein